MSQRPLLITEHSPSYWRVTFDSPPLNLVGVNKRVGLTTGDELKETQTAFYQALSGPAAQQRAAAAFALGLQTPGDFERDLRRCVVELS